MAANSTITLNFSETVAIAGTVQVVGSVSLTQNLYADDKRQYDLYPEPQCFYGWGDGYGHRSGDAG